MKYDLEPSRDVLKSFLSEISEVKKIQMSISAPICAPFNIRDRTPDLSNIEFTPAPESFWEKDNAYTWITAEAQHYNQFLMNNPKINKVPEYYLEPAQPLYQEWLDKEKEVTYRGTIIPAPGELNLNDYLISLLAYIQEGNEKRAVWIKSLKSFLQYIRKDIPFELQGTLECIFPYKMEIHRGEILDHTQATPTKQEYGFISRNIEEPVYPIDILAATEILQNMAKAVLEGRPNGQLTAAEALGFTWLCHAIGSARLMTQEKVVYNTSLKAIKVIDSDVSSRPQPRHFITILTFHGYKDVPISKTLHDFLIALPRAKDQDSLFSKPLSTLLRTLYDKGIGQSERTKLLGKITFRTFMSQSTHWYGHRPGQEKIKQSHSS